MIKELNYRQVLSDFQYKPNWVFTAYTHENRWYLRMDMWVENSRTAVEPWDLRPQRWREMDFGSFRAPGMRQMDYEAVFSPSRELTLVHSQFMIPPYGPGDEEAFLKFVMFGIKSTENHEIFEWARYKGELIHDPHKE